MDSILNSIKKALGLEADYPAFDAEIVLHINSVFMILHQLGIGPETGFAITGAADEWTSFLDDPVKLNLVKSYVYLKVRLLFDPPQNSSLLEAMNSMVSEFEWRLNVQGDEVNEVNA